MEFKKTEYTVIMSEDELKVAIEFYTKHKYGQDMKVKHIKHKVRNWTEGYGAFEYDYSKPDGLEITAE